jgi:hypothetical protein
MARWPTDDELLGAVRDAGWLLEHHALRVLNAADCHPRSAWAFEDPDEPTKSRELDVWSHRQMRRDEANKVIVSTRFLVECKQSSNPYVGIGYDLPEWRFGENPIAHVLPMPNVQVPVEGSPTRSGQRRLGGTSASTSWRANTATRTFG